MATHIIIVPSDREVTIDMSYEDFLDLDKMLFDLECILDEDMMNPENTDVVKEIHEKARLLREKS